MEAALSAPPNQLTINRIYWALWMQQQRYKICYGGRRSSKSWSVSQLLILLAIGYVRRIAICRKVAATIHNSVWLRVIGALREAGVYEFCDINQSRREITLWNGSQLVFIGADDPEKLKSIEGITDWWLEEATELDESDFDTIDAGLSSFCDPPPQIFLTFNPIPVIEGVPHWIQRRFLSGVEPELGIPIVNDEALILRTYFEHNAFCPESTKRVLLRYREQNPDLWRMWGLGEFTRMKGAIIRTWDRVASVPPGAAELGYGLDFGFAIDPAAVTRVWRRRNEIWVKQCIYETELTNAELSQYMESAGLEKGIDDIIADSAEPKSIRDLQLMGWLVSGAQKTPGYKREAALWARGINWHIVDPSPKIAEEFASWSWKFNKSSDSYMPVPADGNDHAIDSVIYRAYHSSEDVLSRDEVSRAAKGGENLKPVRGDIAETEDLQPLFGG